MRSHHFNSNGDVGYGCLRSDGELSFGLGNLVSSGLIYAFYEWRRKAELSSDRAALLVTDDLNVVAFDDESSWWQCPVCKRRQFG